jgi:signal transduction histidine kinase
MGSLGVRLFVTYLVIIFVTLALMGASLFFLLGGYRDSISYGNLEDVGGLIDLQANAEITSAIDTGESLDGSELLALLRNFLSSRKESLTDSGTSVAVVDRNGRIVDAASESPLVGATVRDLDLTRPEPGQPRRPDRCTVVVADSADLLCVGILLSDRVLTAFPETDVAALIVAEPQAGLGEVVGDLLPRIVFAGLIGVGAALVLGLLLSRSIASPLRNIARAARSVARGNYRQRVPETGPPEVRALATDFNKMTEDVQRSQETLRGFLANISHELKTPLTSIRGFSQAVLDGTIDDAEGIDRSARIINTESARVLRLVEELLDLSRIESGQNRMRQDVVELDELFQHIGEVFALRGEEDSVALEMPPAGAPRVRGDFDRLEQVMTNLLDNAFRHTPAEGAVRVTARTVAPGTVQVVVSDTGRGILPEDLPHLFERFYRAEHRMNGKGHGLGLAISREIVRAHGGDIRATSEVGRGTTFAFTLPSADRAIAPAAGQSRRQRRDGPSRP